MTDKFGQDSSNGDDDEFGVQPVDVSSIPRRSGMTFFASTKLAETAKEMRAQVYANLTYTPPPDTPVRHGLEVFTQTHQELLRLAWVRTEERKLAIINGDETSIEQFEVDAITGEILS